MKGCGLGVSLIPPAGTGWPAQVGAYDGPFAPLSHPHTCCRTPQLLGAAGGDRRQEPRGPRAGDAWRHTAPGRYSHPNHPNHLAQGVSEKELQPGVEDLLLCVQNIQEVWNCVECGGRLADSNRFAVSPPRSLCSRPRSPFTLESLTSPTMPTGRSATSSGSRGGASGAPEARWWPRPRSRLPGAASSPGARAARPASPRPRSRQGLPPLTPYLSPHPTLHTTPHPTHYTSHPAGRVAIAPPAAAAHRPATSGAAGAQRSLPAAAAAAVPAVAAAAEALARHRARALPAQVGCLQSCQSVVSRK